MPREITLAFIGAGGVNFGSVEGPWNHASRIAALSGVRVTGVADPCPALAERRVREWGKNRVFRSAAPYTCWRKMVLEQKPDAVIIGVPPAAHGGGRPDNDIERFCARRGIHLFIEKPLGCLPVLQIRMTAGVLERSKVITSVGYMLRYAKAVAFARRILDSTKLKPRHIILRYACAYSEIRKRDWWDSARSGGPIVEQATHFLDIARYLCGEANLKSIRAIALGDAFRLADQAAGVERGIPPARRAFRTTSANWAFVGGCLGTLVHTMLLHRVRYETDIDIFGDGLHLHLHDPYRRARVRLRRPGTDRYEERSFAGDDPYRAEIAAFVSRIRGGAGRILSPYADAVKSYELSWEISRKARIRSRLPASR